MSRHFKTQCTESTEYRKNWLWLLPTASNSSKFRVFHPSGLKRSWSMLVWCGENMRKTSTDKETKTRKRKPKRRVAFLATLFRVSKRVSSFILKPGEQFEHASLWCISRDFKGRQPGESSRGHWSAGPRICLRSKSGWAQFRTLRIGTDAIPRGFARELYHFESSGPFSLQKRCSSELCAAPKMAQRTRVLSSAAEAPLLSGDFLFFDFSIWAYWKWNSLSKHIEYYWTYLKIVDRWNFCNLTQDFPAQKAFISWRSAGRRGRMAKAGKVVEEHIFQLHLWFCFSKHSCTPRALEPTLMLSSDCCVTDMTDCYKRCLWYLMMVWPIALNKRLRCHGWRFCNCCEVEATPTWQWEGCSKTLRIPGCCGVTLLSRRRWQSSKWRKKTGSTTCFNGLRSRRRRSNQMLSTEHWESIVWQ